jgi:hypothetical protein
VRRLRDGASKWSAEVGRLGPCFPPHCPTASSSQSAKFVLPPHEPRQFISQKLKSKRHIRGASQHTEAHSGRKARAPNATETGELIGPTSSVPSLTLAFPPFRGRNLVSRFGGAGHGTGERDTGQSRPASRPPVTRRRGGEDRPLQGKDIHASKPSLAGKVAY